MPDHNRRILARAYYVFNAAQVDRFAPPAPDALSEAERIANAEQFFAKLDAEVRHGGNRAYYSPTGDFIQLPPFESFKDAAGYRATRSHESVHWNWSPSLGLRSSARISESRTNFALRSGILDDLLTLCPLQRLSYSIGAGSVAHGVHSLQHAVQNSASIGGAIWQELTVF